MMRLLRSDSIMHEMVFEAMMRREAARVVLGSLARTIAVDSLPRWRRQTRQEHLQNGVAALLDLGSEIVWRPGPLAVFFATRERVRAELRYAVAELRQAAWPERRGWDTERLLLVGVPSVAVVAGLVAARMHDRAGSGD